MKRISLIFIFLIPSCVFGQQFPFIEVHNFNPFILMPSYAGIKNGNTLFIDYRSDLTGFEGSPTACQLSYSIRLTGKKSENASHFLSNVGLGGRLLFDKTDIFSQTLLLGTYTYEIAATEDQKINFGLSLGFFRNSIDLGKYYSDPNYVQDAALSNGDVNSKLKFASDVSVLYRYKGLEAGILLSNLTFGTLKYSSSDMSYKPMKNLLLHGSYLFNINDKLSFSPAFVIRGGQNIPAQVEISTYTAWNDCLFAVLFVKADIIGFGFGGKIHDQVLLNYAYSFLSKAPLYSFTGHQVSLGIRMIKPKN